MAATNLLAPFVRATPQSIWPKYPSLLQFSSTSSPVSQCRLSRWPHWHWIQPCIRAPYEVCWAMRLDMSLRWVDDEMRESVCWCWRSWGGCRGDAAVQVGYLPTCQQPASGCLMRKWWLVHVTTLHNGADGGFIRSAWSNELPDCVSSSWSSLRIDRSGGWWLWTNGRIYLAD
jgi:hypothetical protein